jgi:magnesium transporter
MFTVWQYDGTLTKGSIEDMDFHKTKWLDAKNPTKEELKIISEKIGLPLDDLTQFYDKEERPAVTEFQNYTAIVLQSPVHGKKWHHTNSFLMLVSDKLLVTIRGRDNAVDDVLRLPQDQLTTHISPGTSHLAVEIIIEIINDYFEILDSAEEHINTIEDKVFSNTDKKAVQEIFALKNTLVYLHKGLSGNREVLMKTDSAVNLKPNEADERKLRYAYADTVQLLDVAATYRDILTGALDIHLSNVSNNLNAVVKQMTAWGSLVLIPTLIASIYGMNFKHMPELSWIWGYPFALILMLTSATLLYLVFKRKKFI